MSEEKEYKITKEHCLNNIDPTYVCEGCGGKIEPIETVDNSNDPTFWAGCNNCCRFTAGVSKETAELAEKLVCEQGEIYRATKTDNAEYWFRTQQAGWANLLRKIELLKKHPARRTKEQCIKEFKLYG